METPPSTIRQGVVTAPVVGSMQTGALALTTRSEMDLGSARPQTWDAGHERLIAGTNTGITMSTGATPHDDMLFRILC